MHPGRWTAGLALAVLIAPALPAQELAKVCQALRQVAPGQWAAYNVTGELERATVRLAVVGVERHGDSALYWLEVNHSSPDSSRHAIVQLLVGGFGTESTTVRGLIMKLDGQPAMRMPDQMVAAMGQRIAENPGFDVGRRCASAQVLGWETLAVPAGSIRALHLKDAEGEVWLSEEIKPIELVKLQPKQGGAYTLTGYGTDAKSSIAGPVQGLPGPIMSPP